MSTKNKAGLNKMSCKRYLSFVEEQTSEEDYDEDDNLCDDNEMDDVDTNNITGKDAFAKNRNRTESNNVCLNVRRIWKIQRTLV